MEPFKGLLYVIPGQAASQSQEIIAGGLSYWDKSITFSSSTDACLWPFSLISVI